MIAERERPLGSAILGTGFAASAHVDALRRIDRVAITGVLGRSPERSREAATRLGLEHAYRSIDELLDDRDVDVVHVCTPNQLHHAGTSAALAAGKHVLSEKPLGLNVSEAADLAERARAAGVVAGVSFVYRHFPLVQHLRTVIRDMQGGPVHLIHGGYLQDWLLLEDDWNWRLDSRMAGTSRAVGDIGSHWLDLVQHVTGDAVVAVSAQLGRLHQERWHPGELRTFERGDDHGARKRVAVDTEDMAAVLLRFASGAQGACTISQVSAGWKNRLFVELDAAREMYSWDQEEPNRLRIGRRDGPNREVVRDPNLLAPEVVPLVHYPGGHQEGWPDAMRNLMIDIHEAVTAARRGESHASSFATFDEARRVSELVEAIVESGRSGSWVDVGTTQDVRV